MDEQHDVPLPLQAIGFDDYGVTPHWSGYYEQMSLWSEADMVGKFMTTRPVATTEMRKCYGLYVIEWQTVGQLHGLHRDICRHFEHVDLADQTLVDDVIVLNIG